MPIAPSARPRCRARWRMLSMTPACFGFSFRAAWAAATSRSPIHCGSYEEVVPYRRIGRMESRDLFGGPLFGHNLLARGIREDLRRSARSDRRLAQSDEQPGDSGRRRMALQRQGYLCKRLGACDLPDGGGAGHARRRAANRRRGSDAARGSAFRSSKRKSSIPGRRPGCAAPAATIACSKTFSSRRIHLRLAEREIGLAAWSVRQHSAAAASGG